MLLTRRLIQLLLLLQLPLAAAAQVDDAVEQWIEEKESEGDAADFSDLLLQLADNPVNLNDTMAVVSLPFISPFQAKSLRHYITLYGQLLSVKELTLVPGFDSATVAMIMLWIKVEPFYGSGSMSIKDMLRRGRHTVVGGIGGTVETAEGYSNGHYEGDNLHALFCYSYNYDNRISLRLSADKDPTEVWGRSNFVGYHLMVRNVGRIETLVIGRYNLQFGQGVTLWTGFEPFSLTGVSPVRYASGIRAASAFRETGWQEGVAATLDVGHGFAVTAFGSRTSGEWFGGGHVGYRHGNLVLGVTATATLLDDSVRLHDYVYNQDYFRGNRQAAFGVDALWQAGALMLYGEAAVDHKGAPAIIAGARVTAGGDNSFGVTLRHYDERYHNLHAAAYSISETRNEQGVSLDARLRLPLSLRALLSVDLHRFPALRYGSYVPSDGAWLRAQLSRNIGQAAEVSVRYAWRQKQRNVPGSDSTLYLGEETLRQQLQGQLKITHGPWRFTTRGILAWFDSEYNERQLGWLVAQEVRRVSGPWQTALQAAWFDIDGYYARIYLSESNLQYSYTIPALQNRGLRLAAVMRYDFSRSLNLSAKYTLSLYSGLDAVGTGDAATPGNHRQTWHLQLRWKL